MKMRKDSRRRRSAFSREELIAALGASKVKLPAERRDPHTQPGKSHPGVGAAAKHKSRLARLFYRLTHRHD